MAHSTVSYGKAVLHTPTGALHILPDDEALFHYRFTT